MASIKKVSGYAWTVLGVGLILAPLVGIYLWLVGPSTPDDDYVYPDEVVRYPAPPPSEAGPPARSDNCPGTPPDPDNPRRLAPGETQVVNKDKRCGYTFSVIAGNVELDAPAPKIPEKATCMGPEPCELYDMLCPYGKAPTDGGWECKGSGGGTTNEYGVAAGVDLRLGVFHTTD